VPPPRLYKTAAIVLKRFDLGEADRVLTVLTPHDGKLRLIAKGVRRPTSRLGGTLEPWLNLRDRLESAATAWYVGELAERATEEQANAYPVYAVLRRAFQLLDDGMAPGRVARWFEFGLADALGVRPEVERCVECDRVLEAGESFRWVPSLGGVLCERHAGPPVEVVRLSQDALKVLRAYRRLDIEALAALRLPGPVEREVEAAMRRFMRYALEREARSLAFLDEVRHVLPPV